MTAPQPPADGTPRDDAGSAADRESDSTRRFEFHGEQLDFDPYRFGRPEEPPPAWSPTGPVGTGPQGRPPAPGERWTPSGDPGAPEVRPGDYWSGAGSHRGPFPPAGWAPPSGPPSEDSPRPAVDLGKPDPSSPYAPPPGYPAAGGYPSAGHPGGGYPSNGPGPAYPPGGSYPPAPGPAPTRGGNGIAIAGFVVSIAGVFLCWTYVVAIGIGLVGIILSATGFVRARRGAPNRGLAIAGIVIGIVAVVLGFAVLIFILTQVNLQCVANLNGDSSRFSECVK